MDLNYNLFNKRLVYIILFKRFAKLCRFTNKTINFDVLPGRVLKISNKHNMQYIAFLADATKAVELLEFLGYSRYFDPDDDGLVSTVSQLWKKNGSKLPKQYKDMSAKAQLELEEWDIDIEELFEEAEEDNFITIPIKF